MIIRPAHTGERTYVRETALKLIQPPGLGYRRWEEKASPWIAKLGAVVLAEGDELVIGFVIEDKPGVQLLYVRRKFRGNGFGGELMQGRTRDPLAVGFGAWSDWSDPDTSLRSAQIRSERDALNVSVPWLTKLGYNRP